jgi:two-component system chemotaxis sensor kinase CheA
MPQRFVCAGQHYRLAYTAIDADASLRLLVVVSDVTRTIEHDELQREKRETLALFEHMLADRAGFIGFMEEATEIVSRIVNDRGDDPGELKRALHTLKGNAALFGLLSVAETCHELESRMAEEQAPPEAAEIAVLGERWSRLEEQVNRLLGERRSAIEVSTEQHGALERAIGDGVPRDQLLRMVRDLKLEPVEGRLRRFAEQASSIGKRLGKRVALQVSHDGLRLDGRQWSRFWGTFVHAVRNAVDHGIEPPAERLAAAKPEEGKITLRAAREGTNVVIEIEDDGRGIPWDELGHRLGKQGGRATVRPELLVALFAGGLSTAREVTDLSGRGMGMAALSSAVHDLGGGLEIDSETARGTRLRMTFPRS